MFTQKAPFPTMDPLGALGNPKSTNFNKRSQSVKESMIVCPCTSKNVREREAQERLQTEIAIQKKKCEQFRSEADIEREKVCHLQVCLGGIPGVFCFITACKLEMMA